MKAVRLPSLGVAMTEALIVRWCKAPGDRVAADETLLEIETDKATVEVPSPVAGIVGPLLFPEGALVPVGEALTHVLEGSGPADPPLGAGPVASDLVVEVRRAPVEAQTTQVVVPAVVPVAPVLPALAAGRLLPIDVTGWDPARLRDGLARMLLIREFESRVDPLALAGSIPGGAHLSIGQEAVAVGIAGALEPGDPVACGHRSHHHAIAKDLAVTMLMAELFGRATGCCGGRGGTMHVADLSAGFLGGNGIVGAGVGIAMGAALAAQVRRSGQVAVGIMGDGGANTGRTWESVNLAAAWKLPLIVVCENNLYAVETPSHALTAGGSIAARAAGFGLPAVIVDGQDLVAVLRAVRSARERAAAGDGPTFIEARTYRYGGHSTGQVITYRTPEEVRDWRETRDPIDRLRAALEAAGELGAGAFDGLAADARRQLDEAVAFAEASPFPDPATATHGVTALDPRGDAL